MSYSNSKCKTIAKSNRKSRKIFIRGFPNIRKLQSKQVKSRNSYQTDFKIIFRSTPKTAIDYDFYIFFLSFVSLDNFLTYTVLIKSSSWNQKTIIINFTNSMHLSSFHIVECIYATLPRTARGQPIVLGGDPKGKNFLYTNGNSVIIRNIDVSISTRKSDNIATQSKTFYVCLFILFIFRIQSCPIFTLSTLVQ